MIVGCVVDWLLNGLGYLAVNLLISEGGQVQESPHRVAGCSSMDAVSCGSRTECGWPLSFDLRSTFRSRICSAVFGLVAWGGGGFLKTGSKKPRSGGSFSWQLCVLDIAHFFKGILRDWSGVSVGGDVTSV